MADYSDFVRDDYTRPIAGAVVQLFSEDGLTLVDTDTTAADGQFTVSGPDARYLLQTSYGGVSERATILVGSPPEFVGATGPSNNTRLTLALLKAAPVSDTTSLYNNFLWVWTLGDFTARAANPITAATVVKSDAYPLTTGAWIRQPVVTAGEYVDPDLQLEGPQLATPIYGGNAEGVNRSVGPTHFVRGFYHSKVNVSMSYNGGSGGTVTALSGGVARVGGPLNDTTVEGCSIWLDLIDSTAAPFAVNPIAFTGRVTANVDMRDGLGRFGGLFAGNDVAVLGPNATGGGIICREIDYGGTAGNGNQAQTMIGLAIVRWGDLQAPAVGQNDCHLYIGSSATLAGNGQVPGNCGSRYGIIIGSAFGPAGYGAPVSAGGSSIAMLVNSDAWSPYAHLDTRQVPTTGGVVVSQYNVMGERNLVLKAPNHGIEIGDPTQANSPHMDWHSGTGGPLVDRDGRMSCVGGGGGGSDTGQFLFEALGGIAYNGPIRPTLPNTTTIGTSAFPVAGGFTQTAFAVTSDERRKTPLEPFDDRMWAFIMALRVGSFQYLDQSAPAVMGALPITRQKTEMVEVDDFEISTIDGVEASRPIKKLVPKLLTRTVPVLNADGTQAMVPVPNTSAEADPAAASTRRTKLVPATTEVPDMETVEEPYEVTPAVVEEYRRTHWGVTAQQLRQALYDSGLDTDEDFTRSVCAVFTYDAAADLYGVRYSQLHAAEIHCIQRLAARVALLEAA